MRLSIVSFIASVWLATPTIAHVLSPAAQQMENSEFSLPDLVQQSALPNGWQVSDSAVFEEGRVVLASAKGSKGSIWHSKPYNLHDAFTIEWTWRSMEHKGKGSGGISFWLLEDDGSSLPKMGSARFNGLQILVDSDSNLGSSARAIVNDGTKELSGAALYEKAFGSCLLSYQASSVPLTFRLSYSAAENMLKLQIDNKVCFQTKKFKLPSQKYRLGIAADNSGTAETFELLKMKVFDRITDEVLRPNFRAMPQPKYIVEVVNKETGEKQTVEKSALELSWKKLTNFELYDKIDKLEGKVLANDISHVVKLIEQLVEKEEENSKKISTLISALENSRSHKEGGNGLDTEAYNVFFQNNKKLMDLLEEQQKIREATKEREALGNIGPHADEIVAKLMMWFIPLGFLMLVMTYYTIKIRQDIGKVKLL